VFLSWLTMTQGTTQARSAAQRERRRRILAATVELATQGGFEAVQMREVADGADVALGTLYRYFPSKVHLLVSLLRQRFEEAETRLQAVPAPGSTAQERVRHVLEGQTRALQRAPLLTEAMTRAFMFADSSVAEEIHGVEALVSSLLTSAMAPDRPVTEQDRRTAGVLADVWLASLVGWVTGRSTADDVAARLDDAVRLLVP
jgi:TetR/AcrR family transcriptional regulator, cholesterol catabolism regulator